MHTTGAEPDQSAKVIPAIDWVKGLAILAVIATHAAAPFFADDRALLDVLLPVFADRRGESVPSSWPVLLAAWRS